MLKNKARDKAISDIIASNICNASDLARIKRQVSLNYGIPILSNSDIIRYYHDVLKTEVPEPMFPILKKRSVRTISGIAPVAVLTKPHDCPGRCAYCPSEKNVPQSYLSNEPAVMRAIRCGYDPYTQVQDRLKALKQNGHKPEKIELIVIGGTWSVLAPEYKYQFILNCFRAANDFGYTRDRTNLKNATSDKMSLVELRQSLSREQKKNESSRYRIIGITLETRPDYINREELIEMRQLGCTRVELGVQAIDDEILKLNRRGHGIKAIADATAMLRGFGFKITYHLMPGLPGSTPQKDLMMFKDLFEDERFQPDQIKFYPTVVTKGSLLYRWWKQGKFIPYGDKALRDLIIACKKAVPPYVRIIRLIRDIPAESIIAGNSVTNLRQIMKQLGASCRCIRCREAGNREYDPGKSKLKKIEYKTSGGAEIFIQIESENEKILFGFCRLRVPLSTSPDAPEVLQGATLIRELHVYGELVPVGKKGTVQHKGLGYRLMVEAEKISQEYGFKKIAVISGIGVRGYYRKLGYRQSGNYMVKKLDGLKPKQ